MRISRVVALGTLAGTFVAACGGRGLNPAMQGKQGMLSETAVAKKCEEAKDGHDRPFVVEWDATDLANFEATARQRTLFVQYEGCSLKVLYECRDPNLQARFGSYGAPQLTSGTVQGFDIKNEGELYAKLPLGAANLSGRVQEGEALHLKYFVSGVAQSSRESIYQNEIKAMPGCEKATHFVYGYNLGAFELETTSKTSAEAEASMAGVGAAGGKGSREKAEVGHGGDIASCSTQDQRGCRVPIRLALRAVHAGDNPADAAPVPGGTAGGPGSAGVNTALASYKEAATVEASAAEAIQNGIKALHEQHDGQACLRQLDRAVQLDPRKADDRGFRFTYPRCLMSAGKCDEGTKRQRELLATEDEKRLKSDETLDREARDVANQMCPSSTAKNDIDFELRASRELSVAAQAKNPKECKAGFEKVLGKAKASEAAWKADYQARKPMPNQHPMNMATSSLHAAAKCVAEGVSCSEGLALHKRAYCLQLRDSSNCEKIATENWETSKKLGHITCK